MCVCFCSSDFPQTFDVNLGPGEFAVMTHPCCWLANIAHRPVAPWRREKHPESSTPPNYPLIQSDVSRLDF